MRSRTGGMVGPAQGAGQGNRLRRCSWLLAGCFWRSYAPRGCAPTPRCWWRSRARASTWCATGRLTAESMPELTYPLERAEAFARAGPARARGDAAPPSLAAFDALIARYRDVRRRPRPRPARARAARTPRPRSPRRSPRSRSARGGGAARRCVAEAAGGRALTLSRAAAASTRFSSFTVASSAETDCPSCGWMTCGASSASGSSTKRRLCISGWGILSDALLDDLLVAEQDVEVDDARAPALALHALAPHRLLDRLAAA